MVWKIIHVLGARPVFPPKVVIQVKALACELPWEQGIPLSRFSSSEIATEVVQREGLLPRLVVLRFGAGCRKMP